MAIEVTRAVLDSLLAEAAKAGRMECCGLLLGKVEGGIERIDAVRPCANVADDPATRFEIDPAALLAAHKAARAGGSQILGYYHSHPTGHPVPSATDCEHASGDGRVWAIVASGEATFWRDGPEGLQAADWTEAGGDG